MKLIVDEIMDIHESVYETFETEMGRKEGRVED